MKCEDPREHDKPVGLALSNCSFLLGIVRWRVEGRRCLAVTSYL